ncbi:MAG: hypothetical protein K8I03_10410 [Ignavibacteria bacterium]|nr:hypothetical protein [Ignavibacteria bacterium]
MRTQELKNSIIEQINKIDDEDFLKALLIFMNKLKEGTTDFDFFEHYQKKKKSKSK